MQSPVPRTRAWHAQSAGQAGKEVFSMRFREGGVHGVLDVVASMASMFFASIRLNSSEMPCGK